MKQLSYILPAAKQPCAWCGKPSGGSMHIFKDGAWVPVGPAAPASHVLVLQRAKLRVVHHVGEGVEGSGCADLDPMFTYLTSEHLPSITEAIGTIAARGLDRVVRLKRDTKRMRVKR